MDDGMIDLMTGDAILRQRLSTYAELRLTPDAATSARIRARVLAVAHRQAQLARSDAALTVVREVPTVRQTVTRHGRTALRRATTALLVASLSVGVAAGAAFAAKAGGPLYEARLWTETVTLPSEPSRRAVAELERLQLRLTEASQAIREGDLAGASAALTAYESIVDRASEEATDSGDEVAAAIFTTGVGHNVEVLQALLSTVPDTAADVISRALARAIERSDAAIDQIGRRRGNGGTPNDQQGEGGPEAKPTAAPGAGGAPTAVPTGKPEPVPVNDQGGNGGGGSNGGGAPDATHHPDKPDKTPKPTPDPNQD
jgi:hypothetical protein